MNIVVLGAGVIGITSAYYLAKSGHTVTVVDRQPGPALETSFANAGEVSPGYSSPWAAPGVPMKAMKWLFMTHAPLVIRPMVDVATWRWMLAMLGNCSTAARLQGEQGPHGAPCRIQPRPAGRSAGADGISYDARMLGTLQVFRTQKQLDGIAKDIEVLRADGVPFEVLDRAGASPPSRGWRLRRTISWAGCACRATRRATASSSPTRSRTSARALRDLPLCVDIRGLRMQGGRVAAVQTGVGEIGGDLSIAALGSYTPALVKPLGWTCPSIR